MARFRGFVQGERGPASRFGHGELLVKAQSWNGEVRVWLSPMHEPTKKGERSTSKDEDWAQITVGAHPNTGQAGYDLCLYNGNLAALRTPEGQKAWIKALVRNHKLRREIIAEFAEEALREERGQ